MQISFPIHVLKDVVVNVEEEDLVLAYDVLKKVFIRFITYHDFQEGCTDCSDAIISICKNYDVNPHCTADRVAFFSALLGISPLDPDPKINYHG